MFNVNNRKTIARLSNRFLRAARLRNGMAIGAITLTSVLFTTLFTLSISSIDAFQQATMRQAGSDGHAAVKYIDDEIYNNIRNHPLIKEISYNRILSDSVDNPELLKRHGEFWYYDDIGLEQSFCEPTAGHRPLAADEIMMDTKTLQLLGLPQEIGTAVHLKLSIKGKQVERDFVLSGWWESDPAFSVSIIVASRAYMDAHQEELVNTYYKDFYLSGAVNAYIKFANTLSMQEKLDQILTERGYNIIDPETPNYVASNLNWAYLSAMESGDPLSTMALFGAALVVLLTGYLIIYNIFQISVLRDIRYYGLLKTIGATRKQIKRIIRRQAAALSLAGIPLGLLIGFAVGIKLVPRVFALSSFAGIQVKFTADPLIFIGSAIFAAVTVGISTGRPGRIAAAASPIEAVRYTDVSASFGAKGKRTTNGGKLPIMAFYNLGRNKKRTALVLASLTLSLVLVNLVFTLSQSLDMDKYLSRFVNADFLIAHADLFNSDYHSGINAVDETLIADLEKLPGFETGGRVYQTSAEYFSLEYNGDERVNYDGEGLALADVYGFDDLPLSRLEVIDGEIDMEKLKSGGYILVGVYTDDFNRPLETPRGYGAVGDKVTLHSHPFTGSDQSEREPQILEYEVMAQVKVSNVNSVRRSIGPFVLYLPANIYLPLTFEKAIASYAFNIADDKEADTELFMKQYTETEQPLMNYESKAVKVNEFNGLRLLILSTGGILSGIVALIGVLNFCNTILTGIIARKWEFAVMQSIGMTGPQLRYMLCMEGLYYALGAVILSLAFGVLSSLFMVKNLLDGLWFATYQLRLWPLFICWPVFILISLVVPALAFARSKKESIVERLRV